MKHILTEEQLIGDFCKTCDYSIVGCLEHGQQSTCASYKEAIRQKRKVAEAQDTHTQSEMVKAGWKSPDEVLIIKNEYLNKGAKLEHEQKIKQCWLSPEQVRDVRRSVIEYIESLFPELKSGYWRSKKWINFKKEQLSLPKE